MTAQSFKNYLVAESRSEKTIFDYTKYVEKMLEFVDKPGIEVTHSDMDNWRTSINHLKPASISVQIAAIKKYFNCLVASGEIEFNPADHLKKPRVQSKPKPYMTADMISSMVSCTRSIRDKAIILLMASTGLRVSELIGISLNDYLYMDGEDGREISIIGKGGKLRKIYINDECKDAIDTYLATVKNRNCDNLFVSYQGGPIHANNLNTTIKNTAKRAGIPFWKEISNHTLRAAYATICADNGVSISTIQNSLGHSSLKTTTVYVRTKQQNINNSSKMLSFC